MLHELHDALGLLNGLFLLALWPRVQNGLPIELRSTIHGHCGACLERQWLQWPHILTKDLLDSSKFNYLNSNMYSSLDDFF